MLKTLWMPVLSTVAAALLLSSCAAEVPVEDASVQDEEPGASPGETAEVATEVAAEAGAEDSADSNGTTAAPISPEADSSSEVGHLECDDDDALAAKAGHNAGAQPVGWPQEWDGSGAMPDPLCHPDYLEIGEWEDFDAHFECWEGIETSTLWGAGLSQEEIDDALWEQSQARADWEQNPPGGTCAEQWTENEGSDPSEDALNADAEANAEDG